MARRYVCQSPELLFFTQSGFYRGEPRWNSLHTPSLFPTALWWPTPIQTGRKSRWQSGTRCWCSLTHTLTCICVHTRFTLCGPLNLLWPVLDYWSCTHLAPVLASAWKNSFLVYWKWWTHPVCIMSVIALMLSGFISNNISPTIRCTQL